MKHMTNIEQYRDEFLYLIAKIKSRTKYKVMFLKRFFKALFSGKFLYKVDRDIYFGMSGYFLYKSHITIKGDNVRLDSLTSYGNHPNHDAVITIDTHNNNKVGIK